MKLDEKLGYFDSAQNIRQIWTCGTLWAERHNDTKNTDY